jgi:hypothetical protein
VRLPAGGKRVENEGVDTTIHDDDGGGVGGGGGGGGGAGLHPYQIANLRAFVLNARDVGQSKVAAGEAAQSELFSRVLSANDAPRCAPCMI